MPAHSHCRATIEKIRIASPFLVRSFESTDRSGDREEGLGVAPPRQAAGLGSSKNCCSLSST